MIAVFDTIMECGDAKKIDQLLAQLPQPAMINETDYRKRTALQLAVEHGHDDVVKVLLGRGIDRAAKDPRGFTALHLAAELGNDKIVAQLLYGDNNSSSSELAHERSCDGLTALHLAAIRGRVTIVKQLLEATRLELINVGDEHERTAWHFAIEHGHEEVVTVLFDSVKSASGNEGKVMFHYAIRAGCDRIVARLLAQSPELLDSVDTRGHSALELAARHGHDTILAQLLDRRPDSTAVGGGYDGSVLHLAAECGLDTVVARVLVEKPALISGVDSLGQTALHRAIRRRGCEKVMSQLLARRSELIDAVDYRGKTALHLALCTGSGDFEPKIVACLLAHSPAVLDEAMFWNVLNRAADESCDEVVKLLLAYRPRLIRSFDNNFNTCLHRVFSLRDYKEALFSEELMRTVWEMNQEVLREMNRNNDTPFRVAVANENKFAMDLVWWKLSLDEIVAEFATHNEACPGEFLGSIREWLLKAINRDVVGVVFDYLEEETERRMATDPSAWSAWRAECACRRCRRRKARQSQH